MLGDDNSLKNLGLTYENSKWLGMIGEADIVLDWLFVTVIIDSLK